MIQEDYVVANSLPRSAQKFSDSSWYESRGKRLIDVTLCLIAAIVCLPLLLLVGLLAALTSRGQMLFSQERYGVNNCIFRIYKFRTMTEGTANSNCVTQRNDPRITWFGRILRNTKIDELPQIINILKGEMSIIGPRFRSQKV